MSTTSPERQAGFGIIAAIGILVILAGLAGFVVSISTVQSLTFAQDIQGARVYQAAQAGIERALSRWYNAYACDASATVNFTAADFQGISVTTAGTLAGTSGAATTGGVTTATGTLGSADITVGSATGMSKGMRVTGTGIGADAQIKSISGTTVTLTETNTATVTGNITFGVVTCTITATAKTGASVGSVGYVERIAQASAEN